MSVRYLRHASCAYSATPPDLFGNMHASSAWMLFCSAPRQIEIVHSRNAPVVPSAPIDAPRAAMRNPGFASATTKPSHHVMALRSCLSSTWAVATASPPPPDPVVERAYSEQIGPSRAARLYHAPRSTVNQTCAFSPAGPNTCARMIGRGGDGMAELRDRDRTAAPPEPARHSARPVVL